jgi:hypothetical protein
MTELLGTEIIYNFLNGLYDSALARSNWAQIDAGQKTPAELMALKIADIQRRCAQPGPTPELNSVRAEVAVAASHFLNDRFSVSAHWDGLPSIFAAGVAMELLRRG